MKEGQEKLTSAIEVLLDQLKDQLQQVQETKKMINALRKRMGEEPAFPDEALEDIGAMGAIRPDQYYGRPLATSAQEYLERRKQACPAEEILRALEQGGFDFKAVGWQEKDRLRILSISLAKNTKTFHRLPNGTFGLLSWYPDVMKREREGQPAKEKNAQAEASSDNGENK